MKAIILIWLGVIAPFASANTVNAPSESIEAKGNFVFQWAIHEHVENLEDISPDDLYLYASFYPEAASDFPVIFESVPLEYFIIFDTEALAKVLLSDHLWQRIQTNSQLRLEVYAQMKFVGFNTGADCGGTWYQASAIELVAELTQVEQLPHEPKVGC